MATRKATDELQIAARLRRRALRRAHRLRRDCAEGAARRATVATLANKILQSNDLNIGSVTQLGR
jgi:hypothetical protein